MGLFHQVDWFWLITAWQGLFCRLTESTITRGQENSGWVRAWCAGFSESITDGGWVIVTGRGARRT